MPQNKLGVFPFPQPVLVFNPLATMSSLKTLLVPLRPLKIQPFPPPRPPLRHTITVEFLTLRRGSIEICFLCVTQEGKSPN